MGSKTSFVIVSSPAPVHPKTTLIDEVIGSFSLVKDCDAASIIIVLDGYQICDYNRTKVGRVTRDLALRYEQYYENLKQSFTGPRFTIVKSEGLSIGFAMCVKLGLSLCKTDFAFIIQHDRLFIKNIDCIDRLVNIMEEKEHIRYIGFPTCINSNHDTVITQRYGLTSLISTCRVLLEESTTQSTYLLPLIFWYDLLYFIFTV